MYLYINFSLLATLDNTFQVVNMAVGGGVSPPLGVPPAPPPFLLWGGVVTSGVDGLVDYMSLWGRVTPPGCTQSRDGHRMVIIFVIFFNWFWYDGGGGSRGLR